MEDQRENRDNDPKSFNELYMRIIELNEHKSEKLASEVYSDSEKTKKKLMNVIYVLAGISVLLLVGLFLTNAYWVHQFNSYDYYSQDGDGTNYLNSDVEGDVTYGTEIPEKEE